MEKEEQKQLAQEALLLLEPIPEENWITDKFSDEISKCCAIGHYQRLHGKPNDYSIFNCSDSIGNGGSPLRRLKLNGDGIARVNNGITKEFSQATPKARVIAFLNAIINQ